MVVYADGSTYMGSMLNGTKHGAGRYDWKVKGGTEYYDGDWAKDVQKGHGMYSWKDGRTYTGQWENNRMNGEGTFTWKNGIRYEGKYVMDIRHGLGTIFYPTEDKKKWIGEFVDGKQHGEAIIETEVMEPDPINPKVSVEKVYEKVGIWRMGKF